MIEWARGIAVSQRGDSGVEYPFIMQAIKATSKVKYLIEEQQVNPLIRDDNNDIPLNLAALDGSLEVIKYFVTEKQCSVTERGQWGRTSLHNASQEGHLEIVKYIVLGGRAASESIHQRQRQ